MKRYMAIILIFTFFLSVILIGVPRSSNASERALQSIFVDTMFGLLTGTIIATAVTVADGDSHSDDWGRNLGIGASIGAFVGAGFGFASQTRALYYFNGQKTDFNLPMPQFRMSSDSGSSSMVYFSLLDWRY
jgi:hypothetical protein